MQSVCFKFPVRNSVKWDYPWFTLAICEALINIFAVEFLHLRILTVPYLLSLFYSCYLRIFANVHNHKNSYTFLNRKLTQYVLIKSDIILKIRACNRSF